MKSSYIKLKFELKGQEGAVGGGPSHPVQLCILLKLKGQERGRWWWSFSPRAAARSSQVKGTGKGPSVVVLLTPCSCAFFATPYVSDPTTPAQCVPWPSQSHPFCPSPT
eukprot:9092211-Pyramimonas_sp.AAC.2